MRRLLVAVGLMGVLVLGSGIRTGSAQTATNPGAYALSASDLPPGSAVTESRVETNDLLASDQIILHFGASFQSEGRLTGYFLQSNHVATDAAGGKHVTLTLYLVSLFANSQQAASAYQTQKAGWDALPTLTTRAIPLTNPVFGDPGMQSEYIGVGSTSNGLLDYSEVLYQRGAAFVEVWQSFYADDLTPYGEADIPYGLNAAKKLDVIAQQSIAAAPSPTPTATNQPAPQPTATTKPSKKPGLLSTHGQGSHTTKTFAAPSSWKLVWSYDCSNFGSKGNFIVSVYRSNGKMSSNQPVSQLGSKGKGTENYHHSGKFYLQVNSECTWSVTAKR